MSLAQFNPGFPTLYVSGDFTSAAVVAAALESQWDLDFGSTLTFTVRLWEGPKDPDDYAVLTVTTGTPALGTAFTSAPAVGAFVYVVDFSWA